SPSGDGEPAAAQDRLGALLTDAGNSDSRGRASATGELENLGKARALSHDDAVRLIHAATGSFPYEPVSDVPSRILRALKPVLTPALIDPLVLVFKDLSDDARVEALGLLLSIRDARAGREFVT